MTHEHSMPQADHPDVGDEHERLNRHGELPRGRDGDAGLRDERDLESVQEHPAGAPATR